MPLPYKTDSTVFYPMAGRRSITGPETRTRIKKRYRETNRRPWSVCLIVDLKSLIAVINYFSCWMRLSWTLWFVSCEHWSINNWLLFPCWGKYLICKTLTNTLYMQQYFAIQSNSMLLFFAGHLMGSPRMKRKKKCSKWSNYFWPIYKMFALLKLHVVLQLQLVCISKACLHQFCWSI